MSESSNISECRLTVPCENGMHMVPCSRLMQLLKPFDSEVMIHYEEKQVNATSMIDLLTLAAPQGAELLFQATGADSQQAIQAIETLFAEGLDVE